MTISSVYPPLPVLFIGAEKIYETCFKAALNGEEYGSMALNRIQEITDIAHSLETPAAILVECSLPAVDAAKRIAETCRLSPQSAVIACFETVKEEDALQVMRSGAQDVVEFSRCSGRDIHRILRRSVERQKRQASLQEINPQPTHEDDGRLKGWLNSIPDAIVVSNSYGKIVLANAQMERLFGYSQAELSNMDIDALLPGRMRERHTQHRGDYMARPVQMSSTGEREIFALRKDGSEFPAEISLNYHRNGEDLFILGSIRDVTSRKLAEETLSQNEMRFRALVDALDVCLCRWLPDTTLVFANARYCQVFGIQGQAIGHKWLEYTPIATRAETVSFYQDLVAKPHTVVYEHGVMVEDGSQRYFRWIDSPVYSADGILVEFQSVGIDITDRQRSEEDLRRSEGLLKEAQAIARLQSWTADIQAGTFTIGPNDDQILGLPAGVYPMQVVLDFTHPDDLPLVISAWQQAASERPLDIVYRIRVAGELKWVHVKASLTLDEQGQKLSAVGVTQDVTKRKQAEDIAEAQRDLARLVGTESSVHEVWARCLQIAIQVSGMDSGGIYLLDEIRQSFDLICHQGLGASFVSWVSSYPFDSPKVQSLQGGQAYYLDKEDVVKRNFPGEEGLRSLAVLPICHRGQVLGNMNIASHSLDGVPEYSRHAVEAVAAEIGNVIAYQQASKQLRESEEKYRSLIDSQESAISTIDVQGVIHYMNQPGAAPFDISPQLMVGKALSDFFPQQIAAWQVEQLKKVITSGHGLVEEYETRLRGKPGWRRVSIQPIRDASGQVVLGMVNSVDITERKLVEERLWRSQRQLGQAMMAARMGSWRWDILASQLDWSPECSELLGGLPNDYANEMILQSIHPDDRANVEIAIQGALIQKRVLKLEFRFNTRDGRLLWVTNFGYIEYDTDGIPIAISGLLQDITERKLAEEKLRESQERYRNLVENMNDIVMEVDERGNYTYLSPNYAALSGYMSPAELSGPALAHIHPDDFAIVAEAIQKILQDERCTITYRARRKDGEWRWLETTGTLYITADGSPRIISVARDISERKRAEEALRKSQALLAEAQIIGRIGHIEWTGKGVELVCSDEVYDIFEISRDTVVTQYMIAEKMLPEERLRLRVLDQQAFASRSNLDYEYRIRLQDGRERWIYHHTHVTYAENGQPSRMMGVVQDITERKQAEQALRASEEKFRGLMESLNNPVFILDMDGHLLYLNDKGAGILGDTPERLMGRTIDEFLPQSAASEYLEVVQEVILNDREAQYETQGLGQYGLRWYRISVQPIHDETGQAVFALVNGTDIHGLKTAQEELEELNRTLEERVAERSGEVQDLYDNAPSGYHSLDNDGNLVLINQTELSWLGYTREEVIGQPFSLIYAGSSQESFRGNFQLLKQQGFMKDVEYELVRKDGSVFPILDNSTAIYNQAGEFVMTRSTLLDITARKRAEDALRQANDELERALRLKDEFLANMSHELRTPLNAILGICEILLDGYRGPLNDRQQNFVRTIDTSGRHLLNLINDMLDVSKIESGKLELHQEAVYIVEICESSLAFVKEMAGKKSIRLEFLPETAVAMVNADARRMKQILVNLLSNAVKFTSTGGRVLLTVHANPQKSRLDFSVRDTGIGIAPADLSRLFAPFMQVDTSLSRQYEGTGLGLALVKRLVELHGGEVSVTSELGAGSCFTVSLPWEPTPEIQQILTENVPLSLQQPSGLSEQVAPLGKILLAEDNEINVMAIQDFLSSHGYQVELADNGLEALKKADIFLPDAILLDIQMPELDGLEATRRLRADPRFATTPLIALTALAMPGDRERCLAAGADAYLSKPVRLKELLTLLKELIARRSVG